MITGYDGGIFPGFARDRRLCHRCPDHPRCRRDVGECPVADDEIRDEAPVFTPEVLRLMEGER